MAVRINGRARGGEFISSNLQFYILYTTIDIEQTEVTPRCYTKTFDAIVQMIASLGNFPNDPLICPI